MLGYGEVILIALVVIVLLSYRKLPDAARSLGRSLRVLKAETRGLREDDVRGKAEAPSVRGPLGDPRAEEPPQGPAAG